MHARKLGIGRRSIRTVAVAAALTLIVGGTIVSTESPSQAASQQWTTAWASPMQWQDALSASNFSCRKLARVTVGGPSVRLRLSNIFVDTPSTISATTVAQSGNGADVIGGTLSAVTFGGNSSVTIAAHAEVTSDPVALSVTAGEDLSVSVFLAGAPTQYDNHTLGLNNSYCTTFAGSAGNHVADTSGAAFVQTGLNTPWVSGIQVSGSNPSGNNAGAVVTLGDSITDGFTSTPNSYSRWTDVLARRLIAAGSGLSVANVGISGNKVVAGGSAGPTAIDRFDRDVLGQSNVRTVIIFEGTNDVASGVDAPTVTNALTQLANRAHSAGLRVIGGTLIPRRNGWGGGDDAKEAVRAQVNLFIRTSALFDAVIDFDLIVANRDRNYPSAGVANYQQYIARAYNADWTHPNDAGYVAIGNSIDLNILAYGRIIASGGTCVDVAGDNTGGNGSAVDLWGCQSGATDQLWTRATDGTLRTLGKCLDVVGNGTASLTAVQLWECNGMGAQQWQQQSDGTLRNPQSGRCLETPLGETANNTRLQINDCTSSTSQRFRIAGAGVISAPGGACVDIAGDDNGGNGTAAQMWDCLASARDQHWNRAADGTLRTLGKCLDVVGNGTASLTAVQLWECNGMGAQQWQQQSDGTLRNPQSGRCLETPLGETANNTRLQINDCTSSTSQRFWLT